MKIVVLASRFPYPLERGDKLRLYQQIKELSKYHEVILFACHDHDIESTWLEEIKKYCKEIYTHRFTLIEKAVGLFTSLINGWPFQCGQVYSPAFRKQIEMYCDQNQDAVIFCQLIRMAPYCKRVKNRKFLDYMDAFSLSMKKRAEISPFPISFLYHWESRRVKKYELEMITCFDKVIAITNQDAVVLEINNNAKCQIIPNNIDLDFFQNDLKIEPTFDIGFIGNLGYLPNEEAIDFINSKILSQYELKHGKKLSFLIAGARPTNKIKSMSNGNVQIWSDVNDIRDAYKAIRVLVAPIKSGTGQQNKVLEAMAMGVPVVTTGEVAKGISATNGKDMVIANDNIAFINAIYMLLNDTNFYSTIQQKAKEFIFKTYNTNKINEVFK